MFGIFPARKAKHSLKILITLLLLVLRIGFIYAEDSVLSKSHAFLKLLITNDIACEKQPLTSFESENFPFNITARINSSAENSIAISERNNLIISFTQDFALKNSSAIVDFIKCIEQKKLPYDVELLFSVNDYSTLPSEIERYNPGGTAFFVSNHVNSDSSFAIIVEEDYSPSIELISGSSDIAPLWLVKSVKEACLEYSSRKLISSSFFVFYRNGYFRENKRVSAFLEEHIPALSITSDGSQETFDILLCAADKLVSARSDDWERHYDFFTVARKTFCLNEKVFSTVYVLLAFIIFSILCFLTFRGSNKFRIRIKAVLRIWFIIPEFIILNFSFFYLSSFIFSLTPLSPQIIIPLEFLISIFLPVFLINFQMQHSVKKYTFAVGIIMLLSGIINVFIFANFDISLIILFFIEYLILLVSVYVRNPLLLILILFLQLIPFVPYTIDFLNFATAESINRLLRPSLLKSFILSTIIFPLQLQIIRILFSLLKYSKKTIVIIKQKIQAQTFIFILFTIFCIIFIFSTTLLFNTSYSSKKAASHTVMEYPAEHIVYSVKDSPFMELTNHKLNINASIDVIRYIVKIEQQDSVPLYDSNFAYTLINPHTACFSLPDNPGRNIEIVYVTDSSSQYKVTIDAYYTIDENTTGKETIAFINDSENNISKDK